MTVRVRDKMKRLTGNYRENRSEQQLVDGRHRLTKALSPPSYLSADAQRQWKIHMGLAIQAGTVSTINLSAFVAMMKCAAALERVYRAAMRAGPTTQSAAGTAKASAAWMAYLATDANYRGWCKEFALTPMAGRMVPQLPALGDRLRVIDGDA
jgi:hypothetical protein